MVAWPLGLYDCCGVSDGAAVAMVARGDKAKQFQPDPVHVKALQISGDSGPSLMHQSYDLRTPELYKIDVIGVNYQEDGKCQQHVR